MMKCLTEQTKGCKESLDLPEPKSQIRTMVEINEKNLLKQPKE